MSDLLQIGASGVRAYQTALTTVSENIANADTPGYSKRVTDQKAISSVSSGLTTNGVVEGQGVLVTGVSRQTDALKAASVRNASTDLAKTETGVTWMTSIQGALTGNAVGDRLTSFYASASTLAADPTSSASRATMLESATSVAAAFSATGKALDQVGTDLDATATQATQTLDSLSQQLAKVNDGLGRVTPGTTAAADLADSRDSILDQMSAVTDVNVTTDSVGRATVRLGGNTGPVLVGGTAAGSVTYARSTSGAVTFTVNRNGTTSALSPNGGALAGIVDAAQRVSDAKTSLDAIATDFTTSVNQVQAQGRDLNGNAGAAIFSTGTSATDISAVMTDPKGIAAASVGGGSRDASNLAALQATRTSGAYETKVTTLVSTNAATLAQRTTIADAQGAIRDGAVADLNAVSGVSLDNEAVDLMRFQQAYSASSRVIQVAREIFQSILDIR